MERRRLHATLILILSRRALVSDWIKREWSHARMMGKQVSPILADPAPFLRGGWSCVRLVTTRLPQVNGRPSAHAVRHQ
jgi:hypothetical protein